MSIESHIKSLQSKHAELEAMILEEMAKPDPDFYPIKEAKKQKLLIKEEIARLMQGMQQTHQSAS